MNDGLVQSLVFAFGALSMQLSVHAQGEVKEAGSRAAAAPAVSVLFIGCRSEGQAEALEAYNGTVTSVPISRKAAQVLAYYGSALDLGVLAPRGWYCLGLYGSGGDFLIVSAKPIDTKKMVGPEYRGFDGPVIELFRKARRSKR